MTASLERESASDLDLISAARSGDEEAVAELYVRHHDAAVRYARGLTDPTTAEDLVSEAFARLLESIQAGGGPEVAFRPYLLRTVHNVYVNHVRRDSRYTWVEDADALEAPVTVDPVEERRESAVLAAAFASLPERWQAVLWHTVVESDDHTTVGRLLGLKANAVAALAFRARDGLREAYLDAHLGEARDEACGPYREELAAYARGRLRGRRRDRVEDHLARCPDCTAGYLELHALGADLGMVLAPAILGVTAATYAGAGGSGGSSIGLYHGRGHRSATTGVTAAAAVVLVAAAAAGAFAWMAQTGSGDAAVADSSDHTTGVAESGPTLTDAPPAPPTPARRPSNSPSVVPPLLPTVAPSRPVPPPTRNPAPTPPRETEAPTPSATPTAPEPTRRPSAAPTAVPSTTPTGSPTVEPTVNPTPTPDPATHEDLRLSSGSHTYYGPDHHVEMSVAALLDPTVLTIDVVGLTRFAVHSGSSYLPATCTQTSTDATATRLTCQLSPGTGMFAMDLVVSGSLDVTVRVSAEGNEDPDPTNDVLTFQS